MINSIEKKFSFYDFNIPYENECFKKKSLSVASAYNIDFSNNTIKSLNSFSNYFNDFLTEEKLSALQTNIGELFDKIILVYKYCFYNGEKENSSRIFVVDSTLNLFELDMEELTFHSLSIKFLNIPDIFEKNNKLYFFSKSDMLVCIEKESSPMFITDFINFYTFATFQNKLFFSLKESSNEIYISDELDIENIGTNLSLYSTVSISSEYGEILSLNVFGGYLYAICQYAALKISHSGGEYSVSSTFPISSKIIKESIKQIDDYIVLYSTSGVYLFDGSNIKRVFDFCYKHFNLNNLISTVYNEKYYLSVNEITETNNQESILFEFSLTNNNFCFYKIGEIENLYTVKNIDEYCLIATTKSDEKYEVKKLCMDSNGDYKTKKYLRFNKLVFDDYSTKILSNLNIFAKGKFTIKISSNFSSKTIEVLNSISLRNMGIKGDYFMLEILSEESFEIDAIFISIKCISEQLWLTLFQNCPTKLKNLKLN